jgi:hypothetical protein
MRHQLLLALPALVSGPVISTLTDGFMWSATTAAGPRQSLANGRFRP